MLRTHSSLSKVLFHSLIAPCPMLVKHQRNILCISRGSFAAGLLVWRPERLSVHQQVAGLARACKAMLGVKHAG